MLKNFARKNLIPKLFPVLFGVVFLLSCAGDEAAFQSDKQAMDEVNRINQILNLKQKPAQEDIDSIRKIYGQYPGAKPVRETMQAALISREDWAALENFYRELPASAQTPADKVNLSKVYIKLGRYQDAVETLRPIENETDPEIKTLLANAHFHLGQYEESKKLLDASWEQLTREKKFEEIAMRGMIYFYQGDSDKAVEILQKALEMNPEQIFALNGLSRVYAARGEREKAEEYLTRVQQAFQKITAEERRKTRFVENIYKLQEAFKAKRFQEVIVLANQSLPDADPKNKAALYQYLASSYQALGRQEEAREALTRAKQFQQQ
ncbi:MAG: tetratricopeptide repeat protein [Pyrinomonadaceae bacterium]